MQPKPSLRVLVVRILAAAVVLEGFFAGSGLIAQGGNAVPDKADRQTILHVLNRLGFGARPGDVDRVASTGLRSYIDEQLHPERIDNAALKARLATFETLDLSTRELTEKYFLPALSIRRDQALKAQRTQAKAERTAPPDEMMNPGDAPPPDPRASLSPEAMMAMTAQREPLNELLQAKMLRATLSERQLEEVLTDFWFNHFNVFVGKGQVRQYLMSYERDAIRPNVLGNFRTLLGAVAHSPAMLFYLDNFQSATPETPVMNRQDLGRRLDNSPLGADERRRIMERMQQRPQQGRPARGLNENYAREIMELHTLGVDAGYTQQDVIELARILTGWTIDRPQLGGQFVFRPQMHDNGTKTFLGVTFRPSGEAEGERALDLLANHPSTARHLSYELAQRFVADEPPAALVERAATVFTKTKGDLREVVRTIVTSPEFFAAETVRAKVKTPFEFVVSAARATGATIANAQPLVVAMRNLGMPLYGCQPPTGYSMTADAWVNTGSLLNRMNFAVQLTTGGRVTPIDAPGRGGLPPNGAGRLNGPGAAAGRGSLATRRADVLRGPITIDLTSLAPDTTDGSRDRLVGALLGGQVSDATRQTLARAASPQQLVALSLGSPEFQRR